jgi:hypothetical protein
MRTNLQQDAYPEGATMPLIRFLTRVIRLVWMFISLVIGPALYCIYAGIFLVVGVLLFWCIGVPIRQVHHGILKANGFLDHWLIMAPLRRNM